VSGHIFVCYAHADAEFVRDLVAELKSRGIRLWWDVDIPVGADWDALIGDRLRTCEKVLIVLSPASVASPEVRGELRTALNLGKPFVPVLHRPCDIPRRLQNIQYVDLSGEHNAAAREHLAAVLAESNAAASVPARDQRLDTRALRNRRDFLDDVKTEVAGRLGPLLHDGALTLLKETQRDLVTPAWAVDRKVTTSRDANLPVCRSIVEAFDDTAIAGKLLILGAPGSGKTTTLLELGRELTARAEADIAEPMPAFCGLSSWRGDDQPIASWFVDHLKLKYGVRKDTAQEWLNDGLLTPLFDGLDEVAPELQEACVRAINEFQQEYRPRRFVVCCRIAEYENYEAKLQLNGAIRLLPLSDEQIHDYLVRAGRLDLWEGISGTPELFELARSPLLLQIMTVAYAKTSAPEWQRLTEGDGRHARLFDVYIDRLLADDAGSSPYKKQDTVGWLTWLATTMKQRGQSEFLIEQLQPAWLEVSAARTLYLGATLLLAALLFIVPWQLFQLLLELIPSGAAASAVASTSLFANVTPVAQPMAMLHTLTAGIAAGIVLAARRRITPIETLAWSTARALRGMTNGLRGGALTGLNVLAYIGLIIGVLAGPLLFGTSIDQLDAYLVPWQVAGTLVGSAATLFLPITTLMTTSPRTWLRRADRITSRAAPQDAIVIGLGVVLATYLRLGAMVSGMTGVTLALLFGLTECSRVLSAIIVRRSLLCGLAGGLAVSGVTGRMMLPDGTNTEWTGVWLVAGAAIGLSTGFVVSTVAYLRRRGPRDDSASRQWRRDVAGATLVAAIAGVTAAVTVSFGGAPLIRGLAVFGLAVGGRLMAALSWAAVVTIALGTIGTLIGAFIGSLFGLLRELIGPDVERRSRPNQGIRQSARNIGIFALIGAVAVGVPFGFMNLALSVAISGAAPNALDWSRFIGTGAALFALAAAFVPGAACIQHFVLRSVLSSSGLAPWRYARFLNYATERTLLQRIGGRYRFVHPLLQDHFSLQHEVRH
jgi:hypothetical protein